MPHWNVVYDPKAGGCRPSSAAFEDDEDADPMSGCLAGEQTSLAALLHGHDDFGVVAFPMSAARDKGLGVNRAPLAGEPDHVLIIGKKTDGVRKALVKAARWVHPLPLVLCKAPDGKCTCFPR